MNSQLRGRFITGFSFGGIAIAVVFLLPGWTHLILLAALFYLATTEFADLARRTGLSYDGATVAALGIVYLVISALDTPAAATSLGSPLSPVKYVEPEWDLFALAIAPAILLIASVLRRKTERAFESFAVSFAGFWYVAVLFSFLVRIAYAHPVCPDGSTNYTGRVLLMLCIVLVKFSDIGAYAFGMRWGKHKLIPAISPGKSVEGLVGGYVGSLLTSLVIWAAVAFLGDGHLGKVAFTIPHAIALPLLLTTTGVLGDLVESLFKRSVGVKDSSSRFPGMGGVLDILDSLLFSAPFMYAYIIWFWKA